MSEHACNRDGRTHYAELEPCPRCGRNAGERMESTKEIGRCFIRCGVCGYAVSGRNGYAMPTRNWNRQSRERWERKNG